MNLRVWWVAETPEIHEPSRAGANRSEKTGRPSAELIIPIAQPVQTNRLPLMVTLAEIEAQAMVLTETERAQLATRLLRSLPTLDDYEEEGIAEALRRREEMENDPNCIISWEQLQKAVGR